MKSKGLDFLSSRVWSAESISGGNAVSRPLSEELPCALLPLAGREPIIVGQPAEKHRRGRGLPFPAEAQVPVLGVSENEAGRVLLAAAFERIAKAESEWGQLADTKLGWRPDGLQPVQIDASNIIARSVEQESSPANSLGLVVPDSLGVAGQQAILSAIRGRSVILVPKSVATALAWCRSDPFGLATMGAVEEFVGYVEVADLSLGRWSLTKLPIRRVATAAEPRLVPAHFPSSKRTALCTSGLGVLTRQADADYHDFLQTGFSDPWLSGGRSFHSSHGRRFRVRHAAFSSLRDLEGDGLMEGLSALREADLGIETPANWGQCLGVLVTGALANAKFDDRSLAFWVGQYLAQQVLPSLEDSAARGAAVAAAGLGTQLPTWLEMVDQLDLYYNSRNSRGDLESAWKPVLVPRLVKAGLAYSNPEPITGLKLQAGRSTVQITIRRPGEDGRMVYRRVTSTPGRTNEADIPLEIEVVAHPGQGFALVKIHSKEKGVFDSHLDWQKMEQCEEPKAPALGYIPSAVELVPDASLWFNCERNLRELLRVLEDLETPLEVEHIVRSVNLKINRTVPIIDVDGAGATPKTTTSFRLSRAIGREGQPPISSGTQLMAELKTAGLKWLNAHRRESKGTRWLVKHFGWWHLGCPRSLITPVLDRLGRSPGTCSSDELHLAGLGLHDSADLKVFFRAYLKSVPDAPSPNAWLKAFRNIIKFNEHALRDISDSLSGELYATTANRLKWALESSRPLIAQNCLEALLFCLKRRRYDEGFLISGSQLYARTDDLLQRWIKEGRLLGRPKLNEMRLTFTRFLRTEGNLQDLATLMAEEDEESEE